MFADGTTTISTATTSNTKTSTTVTTTSTANTTSSTSTTTVTATTTNDTVFTTEVPVFAAVPDTTTHVAATASSVGSCDLDTSVDEISVENVPRREEGFFHRLLSRRSTKKKAAAKSGSAEDMDVDRFLFDEATGARPRQREEPPPAGRMQLSYPPDLPPDHRPQQHHHRVPAPSAVAEDVFEPDTFAPIKHSFSLGQHSMATTDDEATSSGDGGSSSVQKSSSSDSVSSAALDESVDSTTAAAAAAVSSADERHRSYSSSDSEHQAGSQHQQHLRPVPAPRPSKLYNGAGGTAADVVVRRKKRDDQPELLKVFARRSLKLGKDGEPEFLLLAAAEVDGGDGDDKATPSNGEWPAEQQVVASEDSVVVVVVDDDDNRQAVEHVMVDVNENQTVQAAAAVEVVPRFKRIQQRREEWEKRLLQQQRN